MSLKCCYISRSAILLAEGSLGDAAPKTPPACSHCTHRPRTRRRYLSQRRSPPHDAHTHTQRERAIVRAAAERRAPAQGAV